MKTGTTILLIFLILFAAFTVLGYLYSQVDVMQAENQRLTQQNATLTTSLNQAQVTRQADMKKISELTAELQNITDRLDDEILAKQYYAGLVRTCEANNKIKSDANISAISVIAAPALLAMVVAGVKFVGKPPSKKQKIALEMTREQLGDYIRFQRGASRKLGQK